MKMDAVVIIPAYNEGKNIANVLSVVCNIQELKDIVVVSDGSVDNTAEVARSFGVRVIELPFNRGKGFAMWMGLKNTLAPVVLFLDADLIGLKEHHVKNLILPVYNGIADMTLGVFTSGRSITDLGQKLTPFLTGQRAVRRDLLEDLKEEDWKTGYGIEVALTRYAIEKKLVVLKVPLERVTHAMKEEKMGLAKGVAARLKMYWEIAKELNRFYS